MTVPAAWANRRLRRASARSYVEPPDVTRGPENPSFPSIPEGGNLPVNWKRKEMLTMAPVDTLDIPAEILASARLTPAEARTELAVALYAQHRLSIGKACELAGLPLPQFRNLLASRHVPAHVSAEDVDSDAATVRELGLV